jgi:3-oxoacyl-[acyl-carrier protein] reductase
VIDLRGRRALVTGGSRGIGAAIARLLADAGASVGIGYRARESEAQQVVSGIEARGGRAFAMAGDFSSAEVNQAFVDRALDLWEGVDIFVGNAGIWPDRAVSVENLDATRWHAVMGVNLHGMFHGAAAAARALPRGGRMVFVSSTAGQRGEAGHADYAASKGAMIAFVKSLAVELGPRDITVNAVAPGWVETEAVARPFAGEGRARIETAIPLGRVATAEDIAGPVLFLASPLARHITGEILNVNGGSVLCG